MIIGLTGPNASGKTEAARYIKSKGFVYHSLSDILREETKKLGIEPLRKNLIKLGNEMRSKNGPGFLARCVIQDLNSSENHIIDSIRNPCEIVEFRKIGDFILVGINAEVKTRFKRSLKRKRQGDAGTLGEFIKNEEKENEDLIDKQQLRECFGMADIIISNDSTIEEFHEKIDEAIQKNKKTWLG